MAGAAEETMSDVDCIEEPREWMDGRNVWEKRSSYGHR